VAGYGKIPLSFEANQGQTDPRVQFLSRGPGYSLFLAPGEVMLSLRGQKSAASFAGQNGKLETPAADILRMKLVGSSERSAVSGSNPLPGVVSYFIGNDPKKWHAGIKTFGKVTYTGIYPGVDLVLYGNQSQLEYDFVIAPGADASRIAWQIDGAGAALDAEGGLVLTTPNGQDGPARFKQPVVYQLDGDRKIPIDGHFVRAGNQVRFKLGSYDHSKQLIIDPVLSYASYLGGSLLDNIGNTVNGDGNASQALAIDSEGSAYVTGYTYSANFPLKDPYQATPPAKKDSRFAWAFVTKFSADGKSLAYSTYLGGSDNDLGYAIAVDSAGSAYITGLTSSPDFPVTGGSYQTICGGDWTVNNGEFTRIASCPGYESAYVTKLSPDGTSLAYSTFLSGYQGSIGNAIAVDGIGRAYVTGYTHENCAAPPAQPSFCPFPTTSGAIISGSATGGSTPDYIFVSVFDPTGADLLYSTLYGDLNGIGTNANLGSGSTYATGIAVDGNDNFYVGGYTQAGALATTAGVLQPTSGPLANNGRSLLSVRGYVAKFSALTSGGSSLAYGTYLGGHTGYLDDNPTGIAVDAEGNVYIAGQTNSPDFPITAGAFQTTCGGVPGGNCATAFVSKLNPSASALVWSSYLGNTAALDGNATGNLGPVAIDKHGDVYVVGKSAGIFYFVNPIEQSVAIGTAQVFVTEFNPVGNKLLFSTYVGSNTGTSYNNPAGLAVDAEGNIYVAGDNEGGGLITTPGASQTTYGGGVSDGFVVKIAAHGVANTKLTLSPLPPALGELLTLTAAVTAPPNSSTPTGTVTFKNGTEVLGTSKLGATGIVTFHKQLLDLGAYSFTAVYSGDGTYSSSTSAVKKITVAKISSATALSASPKTAFAHQEITFSAYVKAIDGHLFPTGAVTFFDGSKMLGETKVGPTGGAEFMTKSLAPGTHSITARYLGSSYFFASTSKASEVRIEPIAATVTTLGASEKTASAGTDITFTAKVTPKTGIIAPTGLVSFFDGEKLLGKKGLNKSGETAYLTSSLAVGKHALTASYAGTEGYLASTSAPLSFTVTKAAAEPTR
jgi:hypothetical protein